MNNIRITNLSNLTDSQTMLVVRKVIDEGRISGESYCFSTRIEINGLDYMVFAKKTKTVDSFTVTKA